jgi:hypothetical protein
MRSIQQPIQLLCRSRFQLVLFAWLCGRRNLYPLVLADNETMTAYRFIKFFNNFSRTMTD